METASIKFSPVNIEERKTLNIQPGDTVRVHQKIQEKNKTRTQVFEGLVLARKHGKEPGGTFTVRRVSSGIGVERIFPLYSPMIEKIEITRRSKVRRAKLYHIREKAAKEIRRQMRNVKDLPEQTEASDKESGSGDEENKEVEKQQEIDPTDKNKENNLPADETVKEEEISTT